MGVDMGNSPVRRWLRDRVRDVGAWETRRWRQSCCGVGTSIRIDSAARENSETDCMRLRTACPRWGWP